MKRTRRLTRSGTTRRIGSGAREARYRFLTDATAALVSSLDFKTTLEAVAKLAVPLLADGCVIDLVDGGDLRRVVCVHRDPAKKIWSDALLRLGAPADDAPVRRFLSMTEPTLIPRFTEVHLAESARNDEHRTILRKLLLTSIIILPLRARARTVGMLWLYSSDPEKIYGANDLALAEDLGGRIGLALDNARLFHEAQEAVRTRDEFLAIASHELRTPLTPLKLQLGRLLRQAADPDLREKLALADRQVDRLTALVTQLLDVSRIASGRLLLEPSLIDLGIVVRREVDNASIEAKKRGNDLRVYASDPVYGVWDCARLEQVIANLLSNAIKYGEGKPIDVTIVANDAVARLSVKDNGIGIPEIHHARIFERFERAVSARHFGGFGLGLWIVRQIVEASGGTIRVESAEGQGALFVVELPRSRESISGG
jgi:signal transduction histidine kinase